MVRKADCLLGTYTFPRVGPFILTHLFQSYCCSLYGSDLWSILCPALQNIEVESGLFLPIVTSALSTELPIFTAYSTSFIIVWIPFCILLHIVPPCLFKPFSWLSSPASFVDKTPCLMIIISRSIISRTIFVLQWLDLCLHSTSDHVYEGMVWTICCD